MPIPPLEAPRPMDTCKTCRLCQEPFEKTAQRDAHEEYCNVRIRIPEMVVVSNASRVRRPMFSGKEYVASLRRRIEARGIKVTETLDKFTNTITWKKAIT